MYEDIQVAKEWLKIDLDRLRGAVMVIGAPDTGKTTFARYLFNSLQARAIEYPSKSDYSNVAFLDGDPGQSFLGPPATITIRIGSKNSYTETKLQNTWRYFIGAASPRGHMLPLVVGASRLIDMAQRAGGETIVYDTSGLVNPTQGGLALKMAKLELIKPSVLFAIHRADELEPILLPLRRSRRVQIIELNPSPYVICRDIEMRKAHRAAQFRHYFATAKEVVFEWNSPSRLLAVLPWPHFSLNCLIALEDQQGFTIGLGIVTGINRDKGTIDILTPVVSMDNVNAIKLGDILVAPDNFTDQPIG